MSAKRGQTEDFFADFLPAIVIIVVALLIGTFLSASHSVAVKSKVASDMKVFNQFDIFSFLRTPVSYEGFVDFSDFLVQTSEAFEKGNRNFFEFGKMSRFGSEYSECDEGFVAEASRFFGDKKWAVLVYEVVEPGSVGKIVFKCDILESFADSSITAGTEARYSEAYLPSSGFTAYKVTLRWKDE